MSTLTDTPKAAAARETPARRRPRVDRLPYLLLLPCLAIIAVLLLWPLGQVVWMSFHKLNNVRQLRGDREWPWIGLENYVQILSDPFFRTVLRNTVLFAVANVALTMILGTLVGLLLNRLGKRMATFVGSCVMLAWATPALTGTIVWKWIFDDTSGLVTWLFNALPDGLSQALFGRTDWTGYGWFNSPLLFFAILTLVVVWHSFPFIAVSVLAGLKSVPSELHEAARVDGAGPWRVFWKVTFPLLRPVFGILIVLSTIWDFKVFTQQFVLAGGTQDRPTFMLSIYSYAEAFSPPPKYGLGAAIAVILTLILLVVTGLYVRMVLKQEEE
ncbi:carbohydrate ABC transporter permease [Micromonospora sagamiensis]|uniref:Carbohydrate ABC transporter membrane protein 1, CUT1 family (TC 3.A.1.1.-) n=1 Tax=Micromonospora sagamiensis TaxID=47875 RepID=A0A562WCI7_9ACTN|nr:sugar ABC transporter permease [Micromonospora sagamiensis]TWJ27731.1 carbohydrate ABC transporter membrane protein 1, CUT1 family (TC 3.A.1.1.-) [Micromonospora sagamiensis]BCL13383.1 sugar ABC transporter permease [Micromonospora sagamiensis]